MNWPKQLDNRIQALSLCAELQPGEAQHMLDSLEKQWPFYWAQIAPEEQARAAAAYFKTALAQIEAGLAQRTPKP